MANTASTTRRRRNFLPLRPRENSLRIVHCPDPSRVGERLSLDGTRYEIGRSPSVDTSIDDSSLSRRHFAVYPGRDGYLVEDFDSTNGTYVGGVRLRPETPVLLNEEIVAAGDTLLVVDPMPSASELPSSAEADGSAVRGVVGASHASDALRRSIATVAPTRGNVLLLGPTGSGKEVAARALHAASGRAGEFVAVNCAAIPSNLAESELFGHEKGAFTGADQKRVGAFARSAGGTLFLDEVGDLPLEVQAKLLRVLEDGLVQPVGASRAEALDLRVVAATHKDLGADQGQGTDAFRQDLLARLGVWTLRLPGLAERRADILPLWHHFVRAEGHSGEATMTEFFEGLLLHDWPLNVREVRSLAAQLVVLAGSRPFEPSLLPEGIQRRLHGRHQPREGGSPADAAGGLGAPKAEVLVEALRQAGGNVKLAAESNGWHRNQLYRWFKRRGVDWKSYRGRSPTPLGKPTSASGRSRPRGRTTPRTPRPPGSGTR